MIEFQLDTASGVATYLQLVQQVHQALRLGILEPGDQLPTAQQVVAKLAINPNTVLKAYRDLEREGLVRPRPGQGTFIVGTLPRSDPAAQERFLASMTTWLQSARAAGLGPDDIEAIYRTAPATCSRKGWHDGRHRDERARQAVRAKVGAPRLHADDPRRQGRRARRAERRRQDDALAPRRRPARAERGVDHRARRTPGDGPAQLEKVGFVAQDTPTYAGLSVAKHLRMGAYLNKNWDQRPGREPDRPARPRPTPEGRIALGRPAGPARAHAGRREATRAPPPRRAGGEPGSARPARVPPGPHGDRRRSTESASCSPHISSPTSSGSVTTSSFSSPPTSSLPARSASCWRRTTASPDPAGTRAPCRRTRKSSRRATRTSRARCLCAPMSRSSIRPGPSSRSRWTISCSPT